MMLWELLELLLQNIHLFALRVTGSGFPRPLTQQEERECLERSCRGDLKAREKLINHNLRLVAHITKKYYCERDERDDLVSIGTVGLIKAVSAYDINKNIRFSTYASRCIENEILMYFRSLRREKPTVFFGDTIDSGGDSDSLTIGDVLADDGDIGESLEHSSDLRALLGAVDRVLEGREREVIVLRYGIGGGRPLTQWETAKRMNISRSYVSRIEKKALLRLRRELER